MTGLRRRCIVCGSSRGPHATSMIRGPVRCLECHARAAARRGRSSSTRTRTAYGSPASTLAAELGPVLVDLYAPTGWSAS